jgi:hypothetical protein
MVEFLHDMSGSDLGFSYNRKKKSEQQISHNAYYNLLDVSEHGHQLSSPNQHLVKLKTLMQWTSSFVIKMVLRDSSFHPISSAKKKLNFILQSNLLRVFINIGIKFLSASLKQHNYINNHKSLDSLYYYN